jgi:prepilin-type N-terminal cleavage/methylation domain-containing protein
MYLQHTQQGFTLVETLVALSIMLLVILGPITIAQKGIQNARLATEEIVAVFLAQEAIEGLRVLRDNQGIAVYDDPDGEVASEWITTLSSACTDQGGCGYDPVVGFAACVNGCQLQELNGRFYGTSKVGAVPSPFTRKVYVTEQGSDNVSATVEVTWLSSALGTRTVRLQTWLYNQYVRYEE